MSRPTAAWHSTSKVCLSESKTSAVAANRYDCTDPRSRLADGELPRAAFERRIQRKWPACEFVQYLIAPHGLQRLGRQKAC